MTLTIKTATQYKKAQLTQRRMHDSGVCLKARCEQNLSSPIPAIDIQHDDYEGLYL